MLVKSIDFFFIKKYNKRDRFCISSPRKMPVILAGIFLLWYNINGGLTTTPPKDRLTMLGGFLFPRNFPPLILPQKDFPKDLQRSSQPLRSFPICALPWQPLFSFLLLIYRFHQYVHECGR